MRKYSIRLSQTVIKKLQKLPFQIEEKLIDAIQLLELNPRPVGCKKLKGRDGYRIRVGDYRIIYKIEDHILVVLVIDLGHRKDIYH